MFSGIVMELGTVVSSKDGYLSIRAPKICADLADADSVAINGACLTVIECSDDVFSVNFIPETARLTNLNLLKPDENVNLELPLRYNGQIGGHLVQGHIDGTGVVASIASDGNSKSFKINATSDIVKYVMMKGFTAIDGTSLTVTKKEHDYFEFATVPYTRKHTIIEQYQIGTKVNIEVDMIIKGLELIAKEYLT